MSMTCNGCWGSSSCCWYVVAVVIGRRRGMLLDPAYHLSLRTVGLLVPCVQMGGQTVQPRTQFTPTASTTVAQPPPAAAGGSGYGAPPAMAGPGGAGEQRLVLLPLQRD